MDYKKWLFFSVLYLIFIKSVFSQPITLPDKAFTFDQLPLNLGLNQRSINCILQDSDGYLWIGTWSGLINYDGYETTIYNSKTDKEGALKSNKVTSIIEDKNGVLWVGTMVGGLFKFDKHRELFVQYKNDKDNPNSLSNNNVWSLSEDESGGLWIGTEGGLNYLDKEKLEFTRYGEKDGISDSFITDIFFDSQNRLWASTEYGVNIITILGKEIQVKNIIYEHDEENSHLHNYVYQVGSIELDGEELFFFSTKKGLKKWDGEFLSNYTYKNKSSSFSFFRTMKIVEGEDPLILVGSELGLNIFDVRKERFIRFIGNFNDNVNLSHTTVLDIFIDRTEVLWVGTKKGLNRFDTYDKDFMLYQNATFDPTKSIITGIVGTGKVIWVSTIGGGLFQFDTKTNEFNKYTFISEEENAFADFIQKLYRDKAGNLWVGTAGTGVFAFHPDDPRNSNFKVREFRHYDKTLTNKLSDDYVMSITGNEAGDVWIGTWSGGLNKVSSDGTIQQYAQPPFSNTPIVSIYADEDNLWVGTRGNGIYEVEVEGDEINKLRSFEHNNSTNGISNNFITKIYKDRKNGFWIGTEEGLNYFKESDGSFNVFRTSDGLVSNEVNSIVIDPYNNLWVANFRGLTVFNIENNKLKIINHFETEDRIQGGFFYNDVAYMDDQGLLYFGGPDGFNVINPKELLYNPFLPKVIINEVMIFDEPLKLGKELNGREVLSAPIAKTDRLVLEHFENSVKFKFSAMHFAAPQKNKYAYKLEGFDEDWKYTEADQRFATYTNLPDGEYSFQVKASNNDGLWNDEYESIALIIQPPWWKTTWSILLYTIVVVGTLYFFRRLIIIRTNYKNNLKLERLERESLENLNKAKLQFFTNVSHEFRTPLTLILGPLERLMNSGEGGKLIKEQLAVINLNTQRLMRLVNQLLDFRKVESSSVELKVAEGNIVKFVKEIKLAFDEYANQRNVKFELYASSNIITIWFDRDQFEKIIFNLLSNAFKHTPKAGTISIKIVEQDDKVELIVEDNGVGISPNHFDKIFERFYSGSEHEAGIGIGLALTKSLVELHHGEISVESEPNAYTRFKIILRKDNDHFDKKYLIDDFKDSEFIGHYTALDLEEPDSLFLTGHTELKDLTERDKLLIVEDNKEVRAYLKSIFLDQYIVLEAENGAEALEIAEEEMPDIIISDVMMPVMDGISFCKQIKKNIHTSHIPVILLTARTSLIFTVEGLEHGADDYITKPFNAKVLSLKVRNQIKLRKRLRKLFKDNEELVIEPQKVTLTSSDERFIKKALESLEENMSNSNYSVEDFGRDVGLSRMQLYRKLKAMTGLSANEFIRSIRLKRAAQLIEQNELTIAEVTYSVGFSDLQYFRSCFKKQFGINPSEYGRRIEEDTE